MKRKLVIGLIGGLIILIVIITAQLYPIAFVDWRPIIFRNFKKDSATAIFYYQKALETYNKNDAVILDSLEVKQEIERAVLDKSIENILINRELKKRLESKEIERMVENKIGEAIKEKEIEEKVKTLYNLSFNNFKEKVLKPQARQEILAGRLLLENKNFDDWLKETKSKAKVIILLPNFKWDGEGVIIK